GGRRRRGGRGGGRRDAVGARRDRRLSRPRVLSDRRIRLLMRPWAGAAWRALPLALLAVACGDRNNGTLLVARVDTDLDVPSALDGVEITLFPERGASTKDFFSVTGRASLP